MSNGNGQTDQFNGFGYDPESISETDAFAELIDAELDIAAAELQGLLQLLTAPTQADLALMSAESSSLRASLSGAVVNAQMRLEKEASEVRGMLTVPFLAELEQTAGAAETLRAAVLGSQAQPLLLQSPGQQAAASFIQVNPLAGNTIPPTILWNTVEIPQFGTTKTFVSCITPFGVRGFEWQGFGKYGTQLTVAWEGEATSTNAEGQTFNVFRILWFDEATGTWSESGLTTTADNPFEPTGCIKPVWFDPELTGEAPGPGEELPPEEVCFPVEAPEPPEELACPVDGNILVLDCGTRTIRIVHPTQFEEQEGQIRLGNSVTGNEFNLGQLIEQCPFDDVPEPTPQPEEFEEEEEEAGVQCTPFIRAFRKSSVESQLEEVKTVNVLSSFKAFLNTALNRGGVPGFEMLMWADSWQRSLRESKRFTKFCETNPDRNPDDVQLWQMAATRADLLRRESFSPGWHAEQITRLTQAMQERCPSRVPSPTEALTAWLSGQIEESDLKCIVKANDFDWDMWKKVAHGSQQRQGIAELFALKRRGIIGEGDVNARVRLLGWLNQQSVDEMFQLTEQIPNGSDLVRMMVRDVEDKAVVDRFKLDDGFVDKFGPQIKEWTEAQGVTLKEMQFQWRAHWQIPGTVRLFDMLHRLARKPNGDFIFDLPPEQETTDVPQSEIQAGRAPLSVKSIEEALKQDDTLPFWVPRLLASSYSLPRRADVRRAFRVGIFSRADVLETFVRQGLPTKTAEALTEFEVREKSRSITNNPWVKQYAAARINRIELEDQLTLAGAEPDEIKFAFEHAKLLMRIARRDKCLDAIRHRVMIGELDRAAATVEVITQTNDRGQTTELVDTWFCERDARSKPSTAAELCLFFKDGIIDSAGFAKRLLEIGIPLNRSLELVERCTQQLDRKRTKEENARLKKVAAAAAKGIQLAAKVAKEVVQAAKQTEAQLRQQRSALVKAMAAKDRREKLIQQAAKILTNRVATTDYDVAFTFMLDTFRRFRNAGVAKAEEIATTMKEVASSNQITGLESWLASVEIQLLQLAPDA